MMVYSLSELKMVLEKQNSIKNTIFIVGKGNYGSLFAEWLDVNNIRYDGFIDKQTCGEKIFNYTDVSLSNNKNAIYIISSRIHRSTMEKELKKVDVGEDQIITLADDNLYYELLKNNKKKINKVSRIGCWKNLYKGKRCFIIGNGPSLKIEDLECLKNEVSFAVNSIYGYYSATDWRPTFYFVTDPEFSQCLMDASDLFDNIIMGSLATFTSVMNPINNYKGKYTDRLFYFFYEDDPKGVHFSENCEERICACGTVTYCALQMAFYMGFEELYLIGMDFDYSVAKYSDGSIRLKDVEDHPKEFRDNIELKASKKIKELYGYSYFADIGKQEKGFLTAKEYADKRNIKIYNATRGGKLEIFERVSFEDLFC